MDEERVLTRRAQEEVEQVSRGRQTQRAPRSTALARNITLHRLAAGLTQEQIGARLNPPVDRNTVSRWENGRHNPGHQNLIALALLFGVKLHQLYDPDAFPDPEEEDGEVLPLESVAAS